MLLNSLKVNQLCNNQISILNLTDLEKRFLKEFLRNTNFKNGSHNLFDIKTFSNKLWAKLLTCSSEAVRQTKESLQARGILLINGLSWKETQLPDGKRLPSNQRQTTQLTKNFIGFLLGEVRWMFEYVVEFLAKLTKRQESKKRKGKTVDKPVDSLCTESESLQTHNVPKTCDLLQTCSHILNKDINIEIISENRSSTPDTPVDSQENTLRPATTILEKEKEEPLFSPTPDSTKDIQEPSLRPKTPILDPVKAAVKSLNKQIDKILVFGRLKDKLKPWTSSVSYLCQTLIQSGKSLQDVSRLLVQQNYATDIASGIKEIQERLKNELHVS